MSLRGERRIAGLWCGQVLERLADYVDRELGEESRRQVQAHLEGCDVCERFGGEYRAAVRRIRLELEAAEPLPRHLRAALRDRLEETLGKQG